MKEIDTQVQEAKIVPIMMDAKRPTPRHIIIKMPKIKDRKRLLKAREKKPVIRRLPDGGREEEGVKVRGLRSTNSCRRATGM